MRDLDTVLRELRGPEPPSRPPDPRGRSRGWLFGGVLVALAATMALVLRTLPDQGAQLRGSAVDPPTLELALTVERGGHAVRVSPAEPLRVGERVFFRVSASTPTRAALWVRTPSGEDEVVAEFAVEPRPVDVGGASGLTAWRFEEVGDYSFHLSPTPHATCDGCPIVPVSVR